MEDNGRNSKTIRRKKNKILLSGLMAGVIIAASVVAMMATTTLSQAQNNSLTQIANSVKTINPEVTMMRNKVTAVDGIQLTEIGKSTTSESTEKDQEGIRRPVFRDGQAELALSHATSATGENVLVGTITNTGMTKFYLTGLTIKGGAANGVFPLTARAVSTAYSPTTHPDVPVPPVTEPLILNPGESISAIISGKWNIEQTTLPIDRFELGAVYAYEIYGVTTNEAGVYNWGISITDAKLP